jgi:hypothetical protein
MLDEAMRLTRSYFLAIYPAVAFPMALLGMLMVIVQRPLLNQIIAVDASSIGPQFFIAYFGLIAISMVYGLVYWLAGCVILVGTIRAVAGQPIQMEGAWLWLIRPRVLGTLLLVAVIMGVGLLCLCLPGFLVGVLFGLVVPIMLIEQIYGTQAMSQSYYRLMYNPEGEVVTHPYLRLAVIWFAGGLIAYIVGFTVTLPFTAAQQFSAWRTLTSGEGLDTLSAMPSLGSQFAQVVLSTLSRYAVTLYVSFCVALFYLDIRNRREGFDLDAILDEAGAPSGPVAPPPPPQQGS